MKWLPWMTLALLTGCGNYGEKLTRAELCEQWRKSIVTTSPADTRATREAEATERMVWLEVCR